MAYQAYLNRKVIMGKLKTFPALKRGKASTWNVLAQRSTNEINEHSGNLKLYSEGKIQLDRDVEDAGISFYGMDWGGLNRCLSNMGIAS